MTRRMSTEDKARALLARLGYQDLCVDQPDLRETYCFVVVISYGPESVRKEQDEIVGCPLVYGWQRALDFLTFERHAMCAGFRPLSPHYQAFLARRKARKEVN